MSARQFIEETAHVLSRLCIVIGSCQLGAGDSGGWIGLIGGFFLLMTEDL